jgi:hypothetical protein
MKRSANACLIYASVLCWAMVSTTADAASPAVVPVFPANPRSFESVVVRIPVLCPAQALRISLAAGVIRVDYTSTTCPRPLCPSPFCDQYTDVRLGQLPAGTYRIDVYDPTVSAIEARFTAQFSVTDTYASKSATPFPIVDYTDLWWSPQEPGWGLAITQHPSDTLVAVWLVYDAGGKPVWYTLQPGQWTSSQTFTGPIYKTTGPYFGGPFDPSAVGVTKVGIGTLEFVVNFGDGFTASHDHGTFSYTVEGVTATKAITRQPF